MIGIKKVEVTPIEYNEGKIIDSASSTDDKTKNTYSMRIIDNKFDGKANSLHTHTKSEITDFAHTHTKSEITDFAHNHDDRYYTETESDNKFKLQSDFAVLTGTITMPAANTTLTGYTDIDYPSGFDRDNCAVISIMGSFPNPSVGIPDHWATPLSKSAQAYGYGNSDLFVDLQSSKIRVLSNKPDTAVGQHIINFKLVLMKIS